MIIHGINDNILISQPPYLGVYQYKYLKLELYKDINCFGVGTSTQKINDKMVVHVSP